jgi:hypothetical protein
MGVGLLAILGIGSGCETDVMISKNHPYPFIFQKRRAR